jgi:hypothetical protein
MTVLTADDIGAVHRYIGRNRPEWSRSLASIRAEGGPWYCAACDGPSYLCYRCSKCGRDLAGDGGTSGR